MPSREDEQSIVLRRFDGTNILLDSAYLGPSYLRSAGNWVPGDTFRLTKALGTRAYPPGTPPRTVRVQALRRVYGDDGRRYLYAVITPIFDTLLSRYDELWVSADDEAWTIVPMEGGGNATFLTYNARYGLDEMNGILYAGNGEVGDFILRVPFGGSASRMRPTTEFTDSSGAASTTPDPGAQILTGTYAYCWVLYDHTNKAWAEKGQTREVTNTATGDAALQFPSPVGMTFALGTRYRAHLFVAPVNLPVEFAHDQTPQGMGDGTGGSMAFATVSLRVLVADGPLLPIGASVTRNGRIFRWHRGRLWFAGDAAHTTAVWATSTLVPGLEQAIFDAGLFFPVNARLPRTPEPVTGLGACMTTENADPQGPLAIFTLSRTYLYYGDILDDPSAAFVQVSRKAGCIAPETVVETAFGLFYVGLRSVYRIPIGGGEPEDIGWPIRPAIEAIPVAGRANCRALFHKGFLKMAIVPAGGLKATVQWWLDLRRGVGQIPSWWGPHSRVPISAWTVGDADPLEPDRGIHAVDGVPVGRTGGIGVPAAQWNVAQWNVDEWAPWIGPFFGLQTLTTTGSTTTTLHVVSTAGFSPNDPIVVQGFGMTHVLAILSSTQMTVDPPLFTAPGPGVPVIDVQGNTIEYMHQPNRYTENAGTARIRSRLVSGELDAGAPFDRKVFTRIRATGFPGGPATVPVSFILDGGAELLLDPMTFPGTPGAQWNLAQWNVDAWGQLGQFKVEGESIMPAERPRGITGQIILTHENEAALGLREVELRYLPVPRPTRVLADDGTS